MFGIGWSELLLILVIALLVLGPTKLPEVAKGLGKGLREFKKALSEIESEEPQRPKDAVYSKEENPPAPADKDKAP
jgi:sec-independent protein translocase protein TatA